MQLDNAAFRDIVPAGIAKTITAVWIIACIGLLVS